MKRTTLGCLFALLCLTTSQAQQRAATYSELDVPTYTLPNILQAPDGKIATTAVEWQQQVRPQLLNVFREQVYGSLPQTNIETTYKVLEESNQALNGIAVRKQVEIAFTHNNVERKALALIYLPKCDKKIPLFIAFNFLGNSTTSAEPEVIASQHSLLGRAVQASRWDYESILSMGYGVATVHYFDFYYDTDSGFSKSILPLMGIAEESQCTPQTGRAISAWAWGYSRILDYVLTLQEVDAQRIIVQGHSRIGKAALWAGAQDERFAMVVSNDSGCMGAALSRRAYGETVGIITHAFPWWFCQDYLKYADRENELPIDQHQLLALIAPRPLYVCSAEEDLWADPRGEFLSACATAPVYKLFDKEVLSGTFNQMENLRHHESIVGYHIRTGKHDVTTFDWESYIRFANRWLK